MARVNFLGYLRLQHTDDPHLHLVCLYDRITRQRGCPTIFSHEIRRQHRKIGFLLSRRQNIPSQRQILIAHHHGGVFRAIHRTAHRCTPVKPGHRIGPQGIASIEDNGIFRSEQFADKSHARSHTAAAIFWGQLPVQVVAVNHRKAHIFCIQRRSEQKTSEDAINTPLLHRAHAPSFTRDFIMS